METSPSPKKKSSKREEQRRIATYKVNNCKAARLQITPGQLSAFVRSIEGNNACQFGIVRLCGLDLDVLYPNPNLPNDKSTLIRFAAKLGRDGIVASLLRGGADPTSFSCTCSDSHTTSSTQEIKTFGLNGACPVLSSTVMKRLKTIPLPLAVWIIRYLIRGKSTLATTAKNCSLRQEQMKFWQRCLGTNYDIPITQNIPESVCGLCASVCASRTLNSSSSGSLNNNESTGCYSVCTGPCSLLSMEGCNHVLCESCYWQHAVVWTPPTDHIEDLEGDTSDVTCPLCNPTTTITTITPAAATIIATTITGSIEDRMSNVDPQFEQQQHLAFTPERWVSVEEKEMSKMKYKYLQESTTLPNFNDYQGQENKNAEENTAVNMYDNENDTGNGNRNRDSNRSRSSKKEKEMKKPKFKALSRNRIAYILMGTTHTQRDEELWKAAVNGSNRRIKALFEAGINVDVRNEYGQSALLLAASHGHSSSVSYLLSIGADHRVCDNAGVYISFSVSIPSSSSSSSVIFYTLRSPQSNNNGNQDQVKQYIIALSDKMKEDVIGDVDLIKNGREIDDKDGNRYINNNNNERNFDNDDSNIRSILDDKNDDNGDHNYSVEKEDKDSSDNKCDYSNNNGNNVKCNEICHNNIENNDNDKNENNNNNNDNNSNDYNDDNNDPSDDVQALSFEKINLSDEKNLKSASPHIDGGKRVNYQMEKISDSHVRMIDGGEGEGVGEKEGVGKRIKEGRTIGEGTDIRVEIETRKVKRTESGIFIESINEKETGAKTAAWLEREEMTSTMKIPSVTYLIPHYATHAGASSLYIDDVFSESFLLQLESLFSRLPVAAPERGAIECASRSYYCDSIGWVTEGIAKALVCLKQTEKAKRFDDFHETFNVEVNGNMAMGMEKEKGEMYKDTGNMESGKGRGEREEQEQEEGGRKEQEGEREGEGEGGVEDGDEGWDDEEMHTGTGKTSNDTQTKTHPIVTQALPNMRFLNYSIIGSSSPPHVDLSRRTKDNRRSTHTFLLYLTDCYEGGGTRLLRSVNPRHAKGSVRGGSVEVEVEVEVGSNDDSCEEKGRVGKKSDGDNNNNNNIYNNNNNNNNNINNSISINADITTHNNHYNHSINSSSNTHKTSKKEEECSSDSDENVLSSIAPRRGRLLIFPHNCPHEGAHTISLPKILLRGEMIG